MNAVSATAGLFAPTGSLRASINVGNPILARLDPTNGEPAGVSVDLAREFARQLRVAVEFVVFTSAAASVEAVTGERADIGFFAIDPARGEGLRFTAPYVLIEGSYLVPESSSLAGNEEVDRAGHRISVVTGSAYDLFLSRRIRQAEIVRFERAGASIAAARAGEVDVAAGIRRLLEDEAEREPGLRVLPGHFMMIAQAMGTPAGRGAQAQAVLSEFVEHMKASGFVVEALARHHIVGAAVAPPADQWADVRAGRRRTRD
jgi:polar amino acid transport system substrate-binding protein